MNLNIKLMRRRTVVVLAIGAGLTIGSVGAAAALSADDDAADRPIPASIVADAEEAALESTGGGTVTETEVDDEDSMYEVEVTLDDGTQVDVQLDDELNVVGTEQEDAGEAAAEDESDRDG